MQRSRFLILLLCYAIMAPAAALSQDEARYALVIGNSNYDLGPLPNPVNDARSIAAVLVETGFETTVMEDVTKFEFETGISAFLSTLPEGAVGLFYYAGHAVQMDGRNFLLPVDARAGSIDDVIADSVSATDLVAAFHAREIGFGIFIFDACRDNPAVADDSEAGRGLASMESQSGETLIAFATQAGEVAVDGISFNSPYTAALVSEMDKPGRDILEVFRTVRQSVRVWTDGQQRPFISVSVEREFSFRADRPAAVPLPSDDGERLSLAKVLPVVERIWWDAVSQGRSAADLLSFAESFPNSMRVEQALGLIRDLQDSEEVPRPVLELAQFVPQAYSTAVPALSRSVTGCDVVAANPEDPGRISRGVAWGLVNTRLGLRACAEALAADADNPRLLYQMGRVLDIMGRYNEAEDFYRLASSMEYSHAMMALGYHISMAPWQIRERRDGFTVDQPDYAAALQLYWRASQLGNLRARTNIGAIYQYGTGVDRSIDEAAYWYGLAAQSGWPAALDALANLHRNGRDAEGVGLDRNIPEAIRLYLIAAELGHTNAMNNLGQLYLSDLIGEVDVSEGMEWLNRAAELGNPYAAFNLGRQYRDGKLMPQDDMLAVALFERASEQAFVPARIALARMVAQGRGTSRDTNLAAFHLAVAILSGAQDRNDEVPEATRRLEDLGLSSAAQEAAFASAEEWLRQNG